jgi:hypothetical protein
MKHFTKQLNMDAPLKSMLCDIQQATKLSGLWPWLLWSCFA